MPARRVLAALISEPTRKDWFSLELCHRTGLGSGTMLQVLFQLEQSRWVESRWENPGAGPRPRRRFYRLTGLGEHAARRQAPGARRAPGLVLVG